ncbi:undecaprenyl-diphosphate phosphatase [Palaeococcus ferrophilus]|uniref:undecaprenyl-diphosphate phosphatase n=1 Tax=Palaeococcus ferrophilus TaxID=83868 RepID=UPI00064EC473|nr:undecaprenyl-diphosphate phosphatase [Palaeococcus ferrophilus]
MDYATAALMGLLQGVTEWLPISSSGQTMLAMMNFLDIPPGEAYSLAMTLHLGTLMALLWKFRFDLGEIFLRLIRFRVGEEERFLVYSTLFTALVGYPAYKALTTRLEGMNLELANALIGVLLIFTGFFLHRTKEHPVVKKEREAGIRSDSEVGIAEAIAAGIAQGIAVLPGVSRSGMTVGTLLLFGTEQRKALRLSFLMAVPAILGALFLEMPKEPLPLDLSLVAVLTSFVVSLASLEVMLKLAEKLDFSKFCFLFGGIALIAGLMGVLM